MTAISLRIQDGFYDVMVPTELFRRVEMMRLERYAFARVWSSKILLSAPSRSYVMDAVQLQVDKFGQRLPEGQPTNALSTQPSIGNSSMTKGAWARGCPPGATPNPEAAEHARAQEFADVR